MAGFLKLIRLPNLLIIGLTLYVVRYSVVLPFLNASKLPVLLSDIDFFLISLSTILIAAAGYCINDYFDTKIDRINKPEKMVVDISIKRRVVMAYHWILNGISILIALFLAFKSNLYLLAVLHLITGTLLIIYSFKFKREFLSGNLVVAFLSGLIPFLAAYYDVSIAFKNAESGTLTMMVLNNRFLFFLFVYILFAFLTTMAREIIKDAEDYEGDLAYGCKTLPIKLGLKKAGMVTAAIEIFIFLLLAAVQLKEFYAGNMILFFYLSTFVQLPLLYLIFKTLLSKGKTDFGHISKVIKLVMLTGVLSAIIVYFTV